MKKKNGFTLIELLAVIIILGILMIIAIPSVTKYISDSRKSSYVDSAKEIIGSARNLVNSGELEMYDTDATYYIDVNCIKTENAMKSPYGDFTNAYVVVTYDGKGYDYFWTSVDDAGQGVKNIVKYDKLDTDDISSDLTIEDISTLRTLDGRGKVILITERNSCKKEGPVTENLIPVNSETGEEGGSSGGSGGTTPTNTAASTILATAKTAGQLNQIPGTNIYIFKGGTNNQPANYVSFNNEIWRIIGIYGNQLKIIRVNENGIPTAPAGLTNIRYNQTTPNDWNTSMLKEYLNTTYYSSLDESAKKLIADGSGEGETKWNVGKVSHNNALQTYELAVELKDTGNIGLMSTYEFMYATDGGEHCFEINGNSYNTCGSATYNWMKPDVISWHLQPHANVYAFAVDSNGVVIMNSITGLDQAIPAVILKPSVKVASGDGTSGNPYILNLE